MKAVDDQQTLEKKCDTCDGEGGWYSDGGYGTDWRYCGECSGAGHVPTPLGQQILDLIRHNMPNLTGKVT